MSPWCDVACQPLVISCTKCWLMSQSLGISEFLCIQCVPMSVSGRMSSSMDSDVRVWMHELMSTDDITLSSRRKTKRMRVVLLFCWCMLWCIRECYVHDSFLHVNIPTDSYRLSCRFQHSLVLQLDSKNSSKMQALSLFWSRKADG